jgi:tripartite-type tricarboxylate transporter receptor subunit TctC
MCNLRHGFVLFTVAASGAFAAATNFPNRPVRYVAASAPAGASDLIARTIGPALSEVLGVQVVIDNRPGAGNTIGAEIAARAVPDGHTIFGCNIASLAVSPALYRKLGYDPARDFAPIGLIASNPNVLTIHPSVPATNIGQFVALAKAQPGKLNYASAGIGTSPQLSMELFKMQAAIEITHVPYKGIGPMLVDLTGGRVESMFSTVPSVLSAVRSAKIRALGVTSLQRDADLPEVPTIAESGMPDFEVISWQGLCTQSAVPNESVERIRSALAAVLKGPDTRKRITDQGFQLHIMPADRFAAFIRAERAKYAKIVKDIGIAPQ